MTRFVNHILGIAFLVLCSFNQLYAQKDKKDAFTDIVIKDSRMCFFDYHNVNSKNQESMFDRCMVYGIFPINQLISGNATIYFHIIVENKGNVTSEFSCTVTVSNQNSQIYTQTLPGLSLSPGETDTIDITSTPLVLPSGTMRGFYYVDYSITPDNQTDINQENNHRLDHFLISGTKFRKDLNNITGKIGTDLFQSYSIDGEEIGTPYNFYYPTSIGEMQIYIAEGTTPGTVIIGHMYKWNEDIDSWVEIGSTPLKDIEIQDIGTWTTLMFSELVNITIENGHSYEKCIAAVELYYGDDNNKIYIGTDPTVNAGDYDIVFNLIQYPYNYGDWVSLPGITNGGLAIRLTTDDYTDWWYFDLGPDKTSCGGQVNINLPTQITHCLWNGKYHSRTITTNISSHYSVIVTTANGNINDDDIDVFIFPDFQMSIESSPVSVPGGNDGTATAIVTTGTPPYHYHWSNNGNTPSISNLSPGDYCVTVTDANNCHLYDCITVESETKAESTSKDVINISPNPVNDKLFIDSKKTIDHCRIFDNMGNCLIQINKPDNNFSIDFSGFQAGLYTIEIYIGIQRTLRRIVKF
mgnify:CR=1 FL=1